MKSFWELNFKDMVSPGLAKVQAAANATFDRLDQGEKQLGESVHKTSEHIEHQESVFMEMGKMAMEFWAVEKVVEWGKEVFSAGMNMESLKIQMETLSETAKEGDENFEKLSALYQKFPILGKDNIMKAGEQLMEMKVPIDEITKRMKQMGDLSGGNGEKMNGIVEAYKKAVAFGSVQSRMLMQQPVLMDEIKHMYGLTGIAAKKFAAEGDISIGVLNKAMSNLTEEGGRFHNMLDNAMEGTAGKVARLKMRFEEWGEKAFTKAAPLVNRLMDISEKYMPEIEEALHDVWDTGKKMFAFYDDHKDTFLALALGMAAFETATWAANAALAVMDMALAPLLVEAFGIGLALEGISLFIDYDEANFGATTLLDKLTDIKTWFTEAGGWMKAVWDGMFINLKGIGLMIEGILTGNWNVVKAGYAMFDYSASDAKLKQYGEVDDKLKEHRDWRDHPDVNYHAPQFTSGPPIPGVDTKPYVFGSESDREKNKGYNSTLPFAGNPPDADALGGNGTGKGSGTARNVILNAKEFVALHFHGITDIEHIKTVVEQHVPRVIVAAVNDAEQMLSAAHG